MNETNNVIPIKKTDRFVLCRGKMGPEEELLEYEKVGVAYLKPGSKTFRLKLFMFPQQPYFLTPNETSTLFTLLSLEEYQSSSNDKKASWQKVGYGEFIGLHIKMKFHLLSEDVFLCLFPDENQAEELYAAS